MGQVDQVTDVAAAYFRITPIVISTRLAPFSSAELRQARGHLADARDRVNPNTARRRTAGRGRLDGRASTGPVGDMGGDKLTGAHATARARGQVA
jgi:hypothetical protein